VVLQVVVVAGWRVEDMVEGGEGEQGHLAAQLVAAPEVLVVGTQVEGREGGAGGGHQEEVGAVQVVQAVGDSGPYAGGEVAAVAACLAADGKEVGGYGQVADPVLGWAQEVVLPQVEVLLGVVAEHWYCWALLGLGVVVCQRLGEVPVVVGPA
jgi:hypothetical protein